jgi:hypothetical protein
MTPSGGCACGALRYTVAGEPVRIVACHCKQCQLRTGSAFGIGCFFPKQAIEVTQGSTTSYERISEAGNRVKFQFCSSCGSTVLWKTEAFPQAMGVAGGSFDDTDWLEPQLHVWAKAAQRWITFPDHAEVLQESNLGKAKPA